MDRFSLTEQVPYSCTAYATVFELSFSLQTILVTDEKGWPAPLRLAQGSIPAAVPIE